VAARRRAAGSQEAGGKHLSRREAAADAAALVLIHSPVVGPFTWAAVAEEMRTRGGAVVVPSLVDAGLPGGGSTHFDRMPPGLAGVAGEQLFQHVEKAVRLVVDDVGGLHEGSTRALC